MALGQLMSTSGVLLGIPCIIARNIQNVSPCSGLVNNYEYISPVDKYFREKYPFSIRYFINKYCNRMCFFRFVIDYLPLFYMSKALILSWWELSSSTAYPFPSMEYLGHRHCGKAFSDTNILSSIELLLFIFCLRNSSIIDPDTMEIIALVSPLQSGCAMKDTSSHNLMTLRL